MLLNSRMTSPGERQPPLTRVDILGVFVTAITIPQLHERLRHYVERGRKALVLNANAHGLNIAWGQDWYREFMNEADIVFCDGAGVQLAARLLGSKIPQRITYSEWMPQLANLAERQGYSFYFLGGRPGVAACAATRLVHDFPRLRILGSHHGYFDKSRTSEENRAVISEVNSLKPDFLLLGFGMPLQERWLQENWASIDATVALTGGGWFDLMSGELRRPPNWMSQHGLEWLGRLFIDPRRLWRRYLVGNPLFVWRTIKQSLAGRSTPFGRRITRD